MSTKIADGLVVEFERSWRMLRQAVEAFPEDGWADAEQDLLIPARQALHIVAAVDLYLRPAYTPGIAGGGERFGEGLDWEGAAPEDLPSQEEQLAYLDDIQAQLREHLGAISDEDFVTPAKEFPWAGPTLLGRWLYILGHNQHHQGILHAELCRRRIARPRWD